MRVRRRWLVGLACTALTAASLCAVRPVTAAADATGPPPVGANCPPPSYPDAGAPLNAPFKPYLVPFVGTIDDGDIRLLPTNPDQPLVEVPHIYASVCGTVQLPQLIGTIQPSNLYLGATNVYVGGLEAIPIQVSFPTALTAHIAPQPAANGGLNISLTTATNTTVNTLGMSCTLSLPSITFTTQSSGTQTGQPVTGPTSAGVAEVVSNDFAVPAVATSPSCPAAIAQTFNKLLGLPAPPGRGMFVAPFTFTFQLTCTDETKPCQS